MATGAVLAALVGLTACGATVKHGEQGGETASGAAGLGGASGAATASSSGGSGVGGSGDSGWPIGAAELVSNPASSEDEPTCPTGEPLNSQAFASIAEKQQALIGRWFQCSAQGIGQHGADAIQIASDGSFSLLTRGEDGALTPLVGAVYHGRVELSLNQVLFVFPHVTEQTSLLFSDEVPYRMYAYNTDFIGYDYVR